MIDTLFLNDKTLLQLDLLSENCFSGYTPINNPNYNAYKYSNETLTKIKGIPVKFYNDQIKKDQDLYLRDFFLRFSHKTYLSSSINKGKPSYDSIINALIYSKVRGIHLDVYSNSSRIEDPDAIPIVRSDSLYQNFKALDFNKCIDYINKNGWNSNYPLVLYLTLNFQSDTIIYNKIYYTLTTIFKDRLLDQKYSFSGKNSIYSINNIKMSDAIGKVIIIINNFPTNNKLDGIVNGNISNKISYITMDKYTKEMDEYHGDDTNGLSNKYHLETLIDDTKKNIFMFYSDNTDFKNTLMNSKGDLFNPNIIDCCEAGVQFTMMTLSLPDKNLIDWVNFFNNEYGILKNKSLRHILVPGEKLVSATYNIQSEHNFGYFQST